LNVVWSPKALRRAEAAVDFLAVDRPLVALEWHPCN
jgi:plasmid stabilization system protein ParE